MTYNPNTKTLEIFVNGGFYKILNVPTDVMKQVRHLFKLRRV